MRRNQTSCFFVVIGIAALVAASCSQAAPDPAVAELAAVRATEAQIQKDIATFDDLDFNVYSNQKWDDLPKSHAQDILVHYPDGHTTTGLAAHIEELKPMFVFAPDTRIKEHSVKFGSGAWTSVSGVMGGTFTKPMPIGPGKSIPPTGKAFKLYMSTIGRWENDVMKEEWLMWDNMAFMKPIGLAN